MARARGGGGFDRPRRQDRRTRALAGRRLAAAPAGILTEAGGLGLCMISAGLCATLLWYPGSPLAAAIPDGIDRRAMMGLVMGLTAIGAFYFKDPDGNTLEILAFPPDKGDPKWHRPSEELFLGIDHTAIMVADTDASLAFWRDRLGMQIVGGSENFEPEQERVNNVFGAHLRITALRADGARASSFWNTSRRAMAVRSLPIPGERSVALADQHRAQGIDNLADDRDLRLAYSGAVHMPEPSLGFSTGLMARDPHGHAVLFIN